MIDIPYATARDIIRPQIVQIRPRVRQTVSQYAVRHRKLFNDGGGHKGDWSNDTAPYLVEPMDCLTDLQYLTVAVVAPGQSGKTTIAENWLLKSACDDPADMLWYMQTDDSLEAYVKDRIDIKLIEKHPIMLDKLGKRPSDNSLHFKRFAGMRAEFLSATHANLINKAAPRVVADEVDAYPASLGDVKALLDIRRQTYGRQSKLLAISHPDRARGLKPAEWTDGVMAIYGDSDRRVWYWQCPDCGAWSSPCPTAARVMTISYPEDGTLEEIEREARLLCPVNGCLIRDDYREEMNRYGRWIGLGQEISEDGIVTGERQRFSTAGFWIVGAMSPFVLGGIGGLARARVKAEREREATGEDKSLRNVMVKGWGTPYSPPKRTGTVDANELADRAQRDLKLGVVPAGARFLTIAIDVQLKYFEYLVRGWGERGENWVIDRGVQVASPASSPADWDVLLAQVIEKSYPLADGSGRHMRIRGAGYDSGGAPGVTQQAYAAWTRWKQRGRVKVYGRVGGRDVYSIVPMKGHDRLDAKKLLVVYPDTSRQANQRAARGNVPLAYFNANQFKDDLAGQLMVAEEGAFFCHFPFALRSDDQPHLWFEQLVAERPDAAGRWRKVHSNARNEALDLMSMNHVIAHLHGVSRIQWDRPPPWAATWDRNTMIFMPEVLVTGPAPVAGFAGESLAPAVPIPAGGSSPAQRRSLVDRLS